MQPAGMTQSTVQLFVRPISTVITENTEPCHQFGVPTLMQENKKAIKAQPAAATVSQRTMVIKPKRTDTTAPDMAMIR